MRAPSTTRGRDTVRPPSAGLAPALLATFGCAFVARALHLWALSSAPYLDGLVVDALGYEEDAQGLVSQGSFPDVFYRPPLYIYLRAALSFIAMDGARPLSILHCGVGAVTASLVALLTWRLCSCAARDTRLRATWIAGFTMAL